MNVIIILVLILILFGMGMIQSFIRGQILLSLLYLVFVIITSCQLYSNIKKYVERDIPEIERVENKITLLFNPI